MRYIHHSVNCSKRFNRESGFTLVELVMVIILIGILSVGVQSLFSSKDAYVDYIAKERLISLGLLAQQFALGVSANPLSGAAPASPPASLSISRSAGGAVTISLSKLGVTVQSYLVDEPIPSFRVDGTTLGLGASETLSWNLQASQSDGADHTVNIVGAQSFSVCFSSSGYVYEC